MPPTRPKHYRNPMPPQHMATPPVVGTEYHPCSSPSVLGLDRTSNTTGPLQLGTANESQKRTDNISHRPRYPRPSQPTYNKRSLMCLPPELRIRILEHYLAIDSNLWLEKFACEYRSAASYCSGSTWAVLHVCKEFYVEGLKIIFGSRIISLNVTSRFYFFDEKQIRKTANVVSWRGPFQSSYRSPLLIMKMVALPSQPPVLKVDSVRSLIKHLDVAVTVSKRHGKLEESLQELEAELEFLRWLPSWRFDNLQTLTLTFKGKTTDWLWGGFTGFVSDDLLSDHCKAKRKMMLDTVYSVLRAVPPIKALHFSIEGDVDEEAKALFESALRLV